MPPPKEQWASLMAKAQQGDQKSYHQLLTALTPFIRNVVRKKVFDDHAVEDLTQTILLALHQVRATYNPPRTGEIDKFIPWLMGILHHKLVDYYRATGRKANWEIASLDEEINSQDGKIKKSETFGQADANIEKLETKDALNHAMEGLTEKQKRLIKRQKLEGYAVREVAAEFGMSENAVKVATHRAIKFMERKVRGA